MAQELDLKDLTAAGWALLGVTIVLTLVGGTIVLAIVGHYVPGASLVGFLAATPVLAFGAVFFFAGSRLLRSHGIPINRRTSKRSVRVGAHLKEQCHAFVEHQRQLLDQLEAGHEISAEQLEWIEQELIPIDVSLPDDTLVTMLLTPEQIAAIADGALAELQVHEPTDAPVSNRSS